MTRMSFLTVDFIIKLHKMQSNYKKVINSEERLIVTLRRVNYNFIEVLININIIFKCYLI